MADVMTETMETQPVVEEATDDINYDELEANARAAAQLAASASTSAPQAQQPVKFDKYAFLFPQEHDFYKSMFFNDSGTEDAAEWNQKFDEDPATIYQLFVDNFDHNRTLTPMNFMRFLLAHYKLGKLDDFIVWGARRSKNGFGESNGSEWMSYDVAFRNLKTKSYGTVRLDFGTQEAPLIVNKPLQKILTGLTSEEGRAYQMGCLVDEKTKTRTSFFINPVDHFKMRTNEFLGLPIEASWIKMASNATKINGKNPLFDWNKARIPFTLNAIQNAPIIRLFNILDGLAKLHIDENQGLLIQTKEKGSKKIEKAVLPIKGTVCQSSKSIGEEFSPYFGEVFVKFDHLVPDKFRLTDELRTRFELYGLPTSDKKPMTKYSTQVSLIDSDENLEGGELAEDCSMFIAYEPLKEGSQELIHVEIRTMLYLGGLYCNKVGGENCFVAYKLDARNVYVYPGKNAKPSDADDGGQIEAAADDANIFASFSSNLKKRKALEAPPSSDPNKKPKLLENTPT